MKNEKFEKKENETKEDALRRAESMLDRIKEIVLRRQNVNKKSCEAIEMIEEMKKKVEMIVNECKDDDENLCDANNEMIVKNRVKIYTFPYPNTLTPRNSLAFQAHLHSNAFFAVKGYLPYDKKDIFKSTNDCYINIDKINRKAITLTTYSELNKITSERLKHNPTLLELDLIAPLYQIMDNIPLYKYTNYIIYSTTTKDFK